MGSIGALLVCLWTLSMVGDDVSWAQRIGRRITHFVDRYGVRHSTSASTYAAYFNLFRCPRQGFYRHPTDCQRFYRCVQFDQQLRLFTAYEFVCPAGLVFDDRHEVCNWPSAASPCDGSSEIHSTPFHNFRCPAEGFFADPRNCRWFYKCVDLNKDGRLSAFEFKCPYDLVFDRNRLICNWKWLTPSCNVPTTSTQIDQRSISVHQPLARGQNTTDIIQPTPTDDLQSDDGVIDGHKINPQLDRRPLSAAQPSARGHRITIATTTEKDMSKKANDSKDGGTLNNGIKNGVTSNNSGLSTSGINGQRTIVQMQNNGASISTALRPFPQINHYRPSISWPMDPFNPFYAAGPQAPSTHTDVHQLSTAFPDIDKMRFGGNVGRPHYAVRPEIPSLHVTHFGPPPRPVPAVPPPLHGYNHKSYGQYHYYAQPVVKAAETAMKVNSAFGSRLGPFVDAHKGPIACERAGLFRHPHDCNRFYECYWDRWLNKFTLHWFRCPVRLVYDESVNGCNWPVAGPDCATLVSVKQ